MLLPIGTCILGLGEDGTPTNLELTQFWTDHWKKKFMDHDGLHKQILKWLLAFCLSCMVHVSVDNLKTVWCVFLVMLILPAIRYIHPNFLFGRAYFYMLQLYIKLSFSFWAEQSHHVGSPIQVDSVPPQ